MAIKIIETALPKSAAGRKAAPIDAAFVTALVEAFKTSATVTTPNGEQQRCLGPETKYDTPGKASGEARRYADAVAKGLEITKVRTRVTGAKKNADGEWEGPYTWAIYLPREKAPNPAETENE